MHTPEHRVVIIYDSVDNSVFESQLLLPLQTWLNAQPHRQATIISFERDMRARPQHQAAVPCLYFKRISYIASWSLWYAIARVYMFLRKLTSYQLFARGPFAGYIATAVATRNCTDILIQARGLAAEEYRFSQQRIGSYGICAKLRTILLKRLEHTVYGNNNKRVTIQAVSAAMRDYLITQFNAPATQITLAQEDIPEPLDEAVRASYRVAVRAQLHIAPDIRLYCYNGSYKPWQCPSQTLQFFKNELKNDTTVHLLIISQDLEAFRQACARHCLPNRSYTIISIQSYEVIRHLAACDVGILFRENDIINFTARPTKALEYYAAGCIIIHNGVIDALKQLPKIARLYRDLPS